MRLTETKSPSRRKRPARKAVKATTPGRAWWQPEETPQLRQWRVEVQYFKRVRRKLWDNPLYREKYVVIKNKRILDVGVNQFDLARKWTKQFPGEAMLITKVELETPRIQLPDMRFR